MLHSVLGSRKCLSDTNAITAIPANCETVNGQQKKKHTKFRCYIFRTEIICHLIAKRVLAFRDGDASVGFF